MYVSRREKIQDDPLYPRFVEKGISIADFSKCPKSVRLFSWLGREMPPTRIINNIHAFNRDPDSATIAYAVSPQSYMAFKAHEEEQGRALPSADILSAKLFMTNEKENGGSSEPQKDRVTYLTFEAKFGLEPGLMILLSPSLMERFRSVDLAAQLKSVHEKLARVPVMFPPCILEEDKGFQINGFPSIPSRDLGQRTSSRALQYIEDNRVVFSNDMRVAAVPPDVAKVLKSSYFPKQDWNDVFTSVNMRELPRMAGDLFNRVSEGRQLVWAFNEGHRQKISLLAIIPSLMALSALDLSEDGTIEGVRCDMRSLGSEQMMAHVRSNFDATHVLLSPNTDRRPHAMRVELPPYQTVFAKAALCAGSGLVNFQGQVFAATDRRPPEKTGRQIGHIMDGKAPITYDDVARFEGFRPLELNSNAAKVAFGHRAGLSQHVMNETRQLIVRVGGEEFCFERV